MKHSFAKLAAFAIIVAILLGMVGCTQPNNGREGVVTTYSITLYDRFNAAPLIIQAESGDTLDSILTGREPSLTGYTLSGFCTATGADFSRTTPITSNLSIYVKFSRTYNEGTSHVTETRCTNGSSETSRTSTTSDGTRITTVTRTDSSGNSETTTDSNMSSDSLITLGINTLSSSNANIDEAISYFEAAYAKDPTNDKAKVFSALADIASISSNAKIARFFSDHIGITNYPSTLNALVSGNWLNAEGYNISYTATQRGPAFKRLESEDWFTARTSDANYFSYLIAANIINGNVNGLDSAIDDLYSALFESDEYRRACQKISSITNPVVVPQRLVTNLNLTEVFGNESVRIGATELKLIASVLNLYKGILEYFQSYSFNTNLSFLKTDFTNLTTNSNRFLLNTFDTYDDDIDPIANGFLSCRSTQKMTDSKNTFISVLNDVIAAYDSMTGTNSIYPSAIVNAMQQGSVLRSAADLLRTAIRSGGKFYIPKNLNNMPTSWPTTSTNCWYIDCKKLFTPGMFSINNLIELDANKPAFYTNSSLTSRISTATLRSLVQNNSNASVYLKLKAGTTVYGITDIFADVGNWPSTDSYINIPATGAAFIYNFYYGGLEDLLANLLN